MQQSSHKIKDFTNYGKITEKSIDYGKTTDYSNYGNNTEGKMKLTKKQKMVYDYICEYVRENSVSPTQKEIQEHFGFKSLGSVQDYIRYLTNAGYLQNDSNAVRGLTPSNMSETSMDIPLLGDVAAGSPIEAIEGVDTVAVPVSMIGRGEHYALNIKGESMIEDGIFDGDIIIVRKEKQASNGETVVATIENEATVKRFYRKKGRVELHPANSSMEPIIVNDGEFEIRGILVGLLRVY